MSDENELRGVSEDGPLLPVKPIGGNAHFDITAMIDLVFLMNLYFLVKMLTVVMGEVDLPKAQRGVSAEMETAVVITVLDGGEGSPALVSTGNASEAAPWSDLTEQEIRTAVEAGRNDGKKSIVIKAERKVLHRYVAQVASAATAVEGMQLSLAVMEYQE